MILLSFVDLLLESIVMFDEDVDLIFPGPGQIIKRKVTHSLFHNCPMFSDKTSPAIIFPLRYNVGTKKKIYTGKFYLRGAKVLWK